MYGAQWGEGSTIKGERDHFHQKWQLGQRVPGILVPRKEAEWCLPNSGGLTQGLLSGNREGHGASSSVPSPGKSLQCSTGARQLGKGDTVPGFPSGEEPAWIPATAPARTCLGCPRLRQGVANMEKEPGKTGQSQAIGLNGQSIALGGTRAEAIAY